MTLDLTWALATICFLSGGAGAYLGSYLRKKGKNLATHEDIDKLVDQVSAVTKTTKEIETKISSDLWDRQKQWELKREILFDAAKRLSETESKLLGLYIFWRMRTNGEIQDEASKIKLESKYVTEWQEGIHSFEETESLIHVSCSRETMKTFAELSDLLRKTVGQMVDGDLEIYTKTKDERLKRFAQARVAIRKELGIKFDFTPQSSGSSATPTPSPEVPAKPPE
jgi:hypothetical protein